MSMEFEIYTDLEAALPKVIDFNFEQLKAELASRLTYYNSLVVTEDAIKGAKADKALLNKLREAIEAKRKEIKKAVNEPYLLFEQKIKELIALIDAPILAIDTQLDVYEQRRKDARRKEIETFWTANTPENFPIALNQIFDERWLNASVTAKKALTEAGDWITKIIADLATINATELEYAEAIKAKYIETVDLQTALSEQTRLKALKARLAEYDRAHNTEAPASIVSPVPAEPRAEDLASRSDEPVLSDEHLQVYRLTFECSVTRAQALELKAFFDSRNISFRRIKE